MKRCAFLLFTLSFLFTGCIADMVRDAHAERQITDNMLVTRAQRQKHFTATWGNPSRTYSATASNPSEALLMVRSNTPALSRGRGRIYDLWRYDTQGCTLVFYRAALEAWQWDETKKEQPGR